MLAPFQRETLEQACFVKYNVQFNLLWRIAEAECAVALQAADGGAVALGTPGRNIWMWIDESRGADYAEAFVSELTEATLMLKLPGVTASPENAQRFAQAYCCRSGAASKVNCNLMAYACPAVNQPVGVPGAVELARVEQTETIADFIQGFHRDCFQEEQGRVDSLAAAARLISSGGLYVWSDRGNPVSMAAIVHRFAGYARIGQVYTPPQERKKGYASALVGSVSQMALQEQRIPVLYADLANPNSNKVYCSLGYKQAGPVDEVEFSFQE